MVTPAASGESALPSVMEREAENAVVCEVAAVLLPVRIWPVGLKECDPG